MLAVPYLVLAFVTWLLRRSGRPAPRSTALPAWTIWLLLAAVVCLRRAPQPARVGLAVAGVSVAVSLGP